MHFLRRRILSVLLLLLIIVVSFYLYKHLESGNDNTIKYIPNKAALVIKVPLTNFNLNNILSETSYWNHLSNIPIINKSAGQLIEFESLLIGNNVLKNFIGSSNFYVSAFAAKSENFGLLYTVKLNSKFNSDSLQRELSIILNQVVELNKRNFNGELITEYKLKDKREFAYVIMDNYFIGSFTSFLVDDAITQYQSKVTLGYQENLAKGLNISSNKLEVVWIYKNIPNFLKIFSDQRGGESGINVMEYYSVLSNFHFKIDSTSIFGFSNKEIFSDVSFINHYRDQKAKKSTLFEFLPASTSVVKQISITDINSWVQSLKSDRSKLISGYSIEEYLEGLNNKYKTEIQTYLTSWCTGNYSQVIIEPNNPNYDEFVFAFFEAANIDFAKEQLKELAVRASVGNNLIAESYHDIEIISIDIKGVLPLLYGNIFNKVQSVNCFAYNNHIIFGNSVEALKSLLDELLAGKKLSDNFSVEERDLVNNTSSNYLIYVNPENSENVLNAHMNETWFRNYTDSKTQLSSLRSFIYTYDFNLGIPESKFLITFSDKKSGSIKLAWKKEFESELATKPFLVKSQSSKIYKILVQDTDNNLYCLNESGEILWKKVIAGKVLNSIEAIDMRSSGQTQFLFNTNSNVYLIDDKGANVLNYPIKLPHVTANELVLATNSKSKELSYYVYCNNKQIYAYNVNGRPWSNWKFRSMDIDLSRNIQCVKRKELPILILSHRNGLIQFCRANGDVIKEYSHDEAMSSNNKFYNDSLVDNNWTSTDKLGSVITLPMEGSIIVNPNPTMSTKHTFNYSDIDGDLNSDFIYLDEDELTAYDQDMIMIMYKKFSKNIDSFLSVNNVLKKEKQIGVVSTETNKIYLFDSDGVEFTGFPVNGSFEFSVLDLRNSGYLNLICTSDKNKLINYRIK